MPLPFVLIANTVPDDILEPLDGLAEVALGPDKGLTMPHSEVLQLAPELVEILNQGELVVDAELLDHTPICASLPTWQQDSTIWIPA